VSEDAYKVITNGIEDYLKRIDEYNQKEKEREKLKLKIREQKIKEEDFKIEFIKAFEELSLVYITMKNDSDNFQRYVHTKMSDTNLFYVLVKGMYQKIGDIKSLDKAMYILKDPQYVKSLIDNLIHFSLRDWEGNIISSNKIIELITGELDLWIGKHIPNDYLYEKLTFDDEKIKGTFEMLLDDVDSEESYDWKALRYFHPLYMCAFSFINALIHYRNISNFTDNTDMITMYKNIKENTDLEASDIAAKLYPIYKNHYPDIFGRLYSDVEFSSFVIIFDNSYNSILRNKGKVELYKEDIEQFRSGVGEDITVFAINEYETLINKVHKLLLSIDNSVYFESMNIQYDLNYKYIDAIYSMLYQYILKEIGNVLPSDVFFILLSEKNIDNIRTLKKKQEDDIIKKERERLLKGDLSREKEQEIDKYSFDRITTGYEFEVYLQTIFRKMGYEVEVTKKSNDQGGDLIIEKDRERTVVQAKFYSSPVGNKAVQEVVAAKSFYEANKGMIVTNNTYTNSAVALAEVNDITLIDGDELNRIRNAILETI
jgi:HJR/Mrr/RecB family endonuclease